MGENARSNARRLIVGVVTATIALIAGLVVAPQPAQAAVAVPVATAVAQILSDTNRLRAAGGLSPLVESTTIDTVAQNWSAQMGTGGSFIHNPGYTSQIPSGWTGAAENIASGFTYTTVVEGWHQSSGHYANIMGDYNAIGIGYYDLNGQTYFTEDFGKYTTIPSPAPAPSSTTPQPVVSGNSILDSRTGKAWTAHAVNWPSFEYACQQGWGSSADGATAAAAAAMASWGITAVRIPLNQDCWLGVDGSPKSPITATSYKAALAAWVSILNKAGLVAILDLHWTAPAGSVADGQRSMPDAQSLTFWSQVSAAYKSSPSVLFETFNEPYSRGSYTVSWSCWKNGGCQVPSSNDQSPIGSSTYTAVGQAQVVAAIRATGATQPILLDGLNYANDLTGWLANKPNDSQLIASWHNYNGQGCSDTTCWNAQVLPVAATVPVIATEFGVDSTDTTYINGFMNWADSHGVGYAPWAWWVTDSSDGTAANLYSLVTDLTNFTPRAPEGTAYHDHLASLQAATSTSSVPVYRFWSPLNQTHFYTASAAERDSIIATYPTKVWTYEGIAYYAFLTQVAGTVPLYRFWSPRLSGHFYTASSDEKTEIIANYPASTWTYEGVAFYVYPPNSSVPNTLAVSRFWSPQNQHHFYTASVQEKNQVISGYPSYIWTYEGDTFRVPAPPAIADAAKTVIGNTSPAGNSTASLLNLPRVAWYGGPSYYSQFPKASASGWTNPSFFPIAVFFGKPGHAASLKAIGINTYMGAEHDGSPISTVTSQGISVIAQTEWTQAEIGNDPRVVGWHASDECDMGLGGCDSSTEAGRLAQQQAYVTKLRSFNDGRFVQANFGNGVLGSYWATTTMSAQVGLMDVSSVDKYAYTSPAVDGIIPSSPSWPKGKNPIGASTYGWLTDQMTNFSNATKPNWTFVETAMPILTEAGARTITGDQIEGAVWNSIIHGASGIAYFQHNNNGQCAMYSLVDCGDALRAKVAQIDSDVQSLAPVINTQSYKWNFGSHLETSLKVKDGSAYIFAMTDGATGSETLTLPTGVTGTITVVGENRTITPSNGVFTDSFAAESSHHIYKIAVG